MTRPGFAFSTRFRVRYAEIDGQRIVFNSRYLEYADVAVTEFWRWSGMDALGPVWTEAEFNVVQATVQYKAPFRYDDMIEAWVRIDRIGNSSMTTRVELVHADTGALHTVIEIVSAHVDLAAGRATPIPDEVRAALMALDTRVA
ncbi:MULTISPECIES: acyl-CoA thioesterase [unclassified Sphingomonas]|jgi:acyl-CoA thioester hydrolase|uniref:acyl-CoA thioesterase n=1 Tax=unclassified Sphingomonas TaxID=196159 RepID=UPI0008368149|nr:MULTISPECIES: thioesterase family protein [unclassified Sphingomonas]MCH4891812.1 YbgC/FadM family acyl-CoA thioesterase [Sphingomonas sp. SFZ2018-12]